MPIQVHERSFLHWHLLSGSSCFHYRGSWFSRSWRVFFLFFNSSANLLFGIHEFTLLRIFTLLLIVSICVQVRVRPFICTGEHRIQRMSISQKLLLKYHCEAANLLGNGGLNSDCLWNLFMLLTTELPIHSKHYWFSFLQF